MSFDIFIQRFRNGDAVEADRSKVLAVIKPLFAGKPKGGHVLLRTRDGEADVYGVDELETGLMINHASGDAIWDVMYELAAKASMTVMPVGCPACVATKAAIKHLPPDFREDARVISSGADLLAVLDE